MTTAQIVAGLLRCGVSAQAVVLDYRVPTPSLKSD